MMWEALQCNFFHICTAFKNVATSGLWDDCDNAEQTGHVLQETMYQFGNFRTTLILRANLIRANLIRANLIRLS